MPFCTRQAVEGNRWSGVTVQTMIASSSVASIAALRQRALRGRDRHVGGRHFRFGNVAFTDSRALHDPLVVRIDELFQVLIGEHSRRRIAPERADFRLWQCFILESLG